jgi:quercetin dioxygenase-like cupin family protein
MKAFTALALLLGLLLALASGQEKHSVQVKARGVKWTLVNLPGVPAGIQQKLLHNNTANKVQSAIVRFPKGFREPRHYHTTCGHSIYILKGRIRSPEGVLTPGTFTYAAVNERHGPFVAEEETEFLFYTDGPFDYFIEDK